MTLIKTSILSAIATVIRMIAGFVSVKIVAIYIGPSGLALMGQMQNFIAMMSNIASAGVNNGVIKYTAEHYEDNFVKQQFWRSALKISLVLIIPIIISMIFLADFISLKLLHTKEYSSVFVIFAISIVFFVLNGLLTSILNGQKEIKKLTVLNIIGALFGLIITVVLVVNYQLYGALVAGIVAQSIIFFITLSFVVKSKWFHLKMFLGTSDKEYRNKLLQYSMMTLVSATMIPLSHMVVREYIGTHIGWDEAGYWQAIWKISEMYLMIITTTLSIYYLPKLSSIQSKSELRSELVYGYKILIPIVVSMAVGIYFFRDLIIKVLFTESFSPMAELFLYQLIGDVFKIIALLLAYIMVAKAMTKLYVFSEILFVWSFVLFTIIFLDFYGLIGATLAFMINHILYAVFIYFNLKKYIFEN